MLVDLTAQSLNATNSAPSCLTPPCHTTEGIINAGLIDLTGTGANKIGLWLEGPDPTTGDPANSFTGNIDMTGSTTNITGDTSFGVKIDSLAELNGDLTLGQLVMKTSSDTSQLGVIGLQLDGTVNGDIVASSSITLTGGTASPAGSVAAMDITGTLNGNLTINVGSTLAAVGPGAEGILLTGSMNCELSDCSTSLGSLVNNGSISVAGKGSTLTAQTGNPVASFALGIGGSIAGGIYNAGQSFVGDPTADANITSQGVSAAIKIAPELEVGTAAPIVIGIYKPANDGIDPDPGFSLYNRGNISTASPNSNDGTQAIFIGGGSSTATAVTLTGGLFNAGTISTGANNLAGGGTVTATAILIGSFGIVGPNDTYTITTDGAGTYTAAYDQGNASPKTNPDDLAALVNSAEAGSGRILAAVSGAAGGEADAIHILGDGTLPSIINQGLISAVATSTDATIDELTARAIFDESGTLKFIENNARSLRRRRRSPVTARRRSPSTCRTIREAPSPAAAFSSSTRRR